MKRVCLVLLVALGSSLTAMQASAQVSVSVNIGTQPTWGPVGYDQADYYYLPDVEAYYYVPRQQFIYLDAGRWIFSASLPARCGNYDLYSGYKVVLNGPRPYDHFYDHRVAYARYRGWQNRQVCIRDNRGPVYDDRGPVYSNRGPVYGNRGPVYSNRGPVYRDDRGPVYRDDRQGRIRGYDDRNDRRPEPRGRGRGNDPQDHGRRGNW